VRVVVRVDCGHLANDIDGLNIHWDVLVLDFVMVSDNSWVDGAALGNFFCMLGSYIF
jgi:hypothetical protein